MSGATSVEIKSEYFMIRKESVSFIFNDPSEESEFHKDLKKRFRKELKMIKPAIETAIDELRTANKDMFVFLKYDGNIMAVHEDGEKEFLVDGNRICRYIMPLSDDNFFYWIELTFERLPDAEARRLLKMRLKKAIQKTQQEIE